MDNNHSIPLCEFVMNGTGNGKGSGSANAVTSPDKTHYSEEVVAGGGAFQMESDADINFPFLLDGDSSDQNIDLDMLLGYNIDDDMSDNSINSNQAEIKREIDLIEMFFFGSQSPPSSIENDNYEDQTSSTVQGEGTPIQESKIRENWFSKKLADCFYRKTENCFYMKFGERAAEREIGRGFSQGGHQGHQRWGERLVAQRMSNTFSRGVMMSPKNGQLYGLIQPPNLS